jgi:hypothetical protein
VFSGTPGIEISSSSSSGGHLTLRDAVGDFHDSPQDRVGVEAGEVLDVFELWETLE